MTDMNPMLLAAKLWERTSAAGNSYLVGRLGGVRVLVMRNRGAGTEGEPDWHLFFAGSDKPRQTSVEPAKPASSTRTDGARRAYQRSVKRATMGSDQAGAMPDDPLDDIGRP